MFWFIYFLMMFSLFLMACIGKMQSEEKQKETKKKIEEKKKNIERKFFNIDIK